jgi:glyoxylase I family protein
VLNGTLALAQTNFTMINITKVHHIAIICSDYSKSKQFYTDVLGLNVIQEIYFEERDSYKLDLDLNGNYIIELFSFPNPPKRSSKQEVTHLGDCLNGNLGFYLE